MLYQPRKTFVHLRNTNEDSLFWLNLWARSLLQTPKGLKLDGPESHWIKYLNIPCDYSGSTINLSSDKNTFSAEIKQKQWLYSTIPFLPAGPETRVQEILRTVFFYYYFSLLLTHASWKSQSWIRLLFLFYFHTILVPFITIKWHLNDLVEADILKIMGCVERKCIECGY